MATADPHTPQTSNSALKSSAEALVAGLSWGGVMLLVFGFWMRSKYLGAADGKIVTNIFLIAGVASFALAAWQAFTLWFQKLDPSARTAALEQQRRVFSYILLGAGIGFILMAFALGFEKKGGNYGFNKDNFAETFGTLLLGLIALGFGYFLQQPRETQPSIFAKLVTMVPTLKLAVVLLWVGAGILLWFVYDRNKADYMSALPEMLGLILIMIFLIAGLIWLNTGNLDEVSMRKFVLFAGGSLGVILFLTTLWQAYLWRQDILLGGITAWQGPNAWKFWLCAYVLFGTLVLMFVSFNLARTDIRKDVVLRRIMYGYAAVVQGLLVIGMLAIFNVVVYALVPFSFDWTKSRGAYAIADSSKNLIAGLKQEAHIFVILPRNHPASQDLRNMLDNCEAIAVKDRFQVAYVSPDINQTKFLELLRFFPQILPDTSFRTAGQGVLIVYGPMPTVENHKTPSAFVPERALYDQERPMGPGQKPKVSFKGEEALMKELKFLVEGRKKRKIYFLQGNDEVDINKGDREPRQDFTRSMNTLGMEFLVERLTADNYEVSGLNFNPEPLAAKKPVANMVHVRAGADKKKNIPDDCHTLVIAAPSKQLPPEALDAIERYMDQRSGRMLVFADVVADENYTKLRSTGLEQLLKRYGVELTDEFIIRQPVRGNLGEALDVRGTPPSHTEHLLARQFIGRSVGLDSYPRVVRPVAEERRYKAETILQIDPAMGGIYYVEKDVQLLDLIGKLQPYLIGMEKDRLKLVTHALREPVSVGVAVSDNENNKPRLVVFGDAEFVTNLDLIIMSRQPRALNYALTASALEWLAEREGMGIPPNEKTFVSLDPSVDYWRMVLAPLWAMTLVFVGLGGGFWLVRRR